MTEYRYLVPTFRGSAWDKPGAHTPVSPEGWPRVGIYCPHEPTPWLLGSFSLDEGASEVAGRPYWSWTLDYPTGDGHLIRLGRHSGANPTQYLVGNAIRNRDAEQDALRAALASGDPAAADAALKAVDHAEANTRAGILLKCGLCRLRRKFRLENVHGIASTFWRMGMREVPLEVFARRVDRRA